MTLKLKQVTGGGEPLPVEVESLEGTVAELKELAAAALGDASLAPGLRLIYKGQILKDPSTLASYGARGRGPAGRGARGLCPCAALPAPPATACWALLRPQLPTHASRCRLLPCLVPQAWGRTT